MYSLNICVNVSIFVHLNIQLSSLDYVMNHCPTETQLREIATQWNIDDFDFFMVLDVSRFSYILIGIHIYIFRFGFSVDEWLTEKSHNDESTHEKLQLRLDRNLYSLCLMCWYCSFIVHEIVFVFHFYVMSIEYTMVYLLLAFTLSLA